MSHDKHGYSIQFVLEELLKYRPTAEEMMDALDVNRGAYYRLIKRAEYPDAEHLRKIGDHFGIDPVYLQERFGLIRRDEFGGYVGGSHPTTATRKEVATNRKAPAPRISDAKPRHSL